MKKQMKIILEMMDLTILSKIVDNLMIDGKLYKFPLLNKTNRMV